MKRILIMISLLSLLLIVAGGFSLHSIQSSAVVSGQKPSQNQNSCEHSPMMIKPPHNRQYYMGELSKKDLRNWPSEDSSIDNMPTPPNQKCRGK